MLWYNACSSLFAFCTCIFRLICPSSHTNSPSLCVLTCFYCSMISPHLARKITPFYLFLRKKKNPSPQKSTQYKFSWLSSCRLEHVSHCYIFLLLWKAIRSFHTFHNIVPLFFYNCLCLWTTFWMFILRGQCFFFFFLEYTVELWLYHFQISCFICTCWWSGTIRCHKA